MAGKNDHSKRAHAVLSASSAHRWLACPPSAVAATLYPDQETEFTKEGTLAHEIAELVASGGVDPANIEVMHDQHGNTVAVTQEMIEHACGYRDYIREQIKSDDALVLLEQRVDFSPWVPDGFGTADCIIIQGNTMDVIDYKYGQGVPVSAENNPQEMLYGLGALNEYGFAYDIETIRLHIYQPRINNISVGELTTDILLAWAEGVKHIAQDAAAGKGEYSAGPHCKFCPHAGQCRKLAEQCLLYVEHNGVRLGVPKLTPFEVAEALQMEPLITLWLKRVKEQALTHLLNGEQVPGYKVVEGKQGNRKWTDDMQVLAALQGAGYSKEDVTETTLLSPASMDKAIGKKKAAELLAAYIDRSPGAPTIAPESDKRPVYNRLAEAQNDFK